MPAAPDDFIVSLSLDTRPLEEIFWNAKHTSFCAVEPSPDRPDKSAGDDPCLIRQRKEEWVSAVGCDDGSIWLVDTGIPVKPLQVGSDKGNESHEGLLRDDSSINSSRSRLFEGFRSPRLASTPVLSRKPSSAALPTVAISPPAESTAEFQNIDVIVSPAGVDTPRSRSESVATTHSSRYANLGLLPSPQPIRAKNSSLVSQTTATARLASISANDERMMQRGLKSQGRNTPEPVSSVTKFAAQVRSGLSDVYSKSDEAADSKRRKQELTLDMNVEVGEFFRDSPKIVETEKAKKEKAMDDEVKEELKAEQELIRLEDQMDEDAEMRKPASSRVSPGTKHILRSKLSLPELHGSAVVALQDCSLPGKFVALTAKGTLVLIDEYQQAAASTLDLNHISRQREHQSTRPNLMPHLRWKGLSIAQKNGTDIIAAYAHLPDEYMTDTLAAHTPVFMIQVSNAAELKFIGRTSIRGCGPLSLVSARNGDIFILHATHQQLNRYKLHFEDERKKENDLQKSKSYSHLGSLLSPMPSRPVSRAASARDGHADASGEDMDTTQGLGRFLGRKRKNENASQHLSDFFPSVVILGEPVAVQNYEASHWRGLTVKATTGLAWNEETVWAFKVDSDITTCATTHTRPGGGFVAMGTHGSSPCTSFDGFIDHCEGRTIVLNEHMLRLTSSALDLLHLGQRELQGYPSPRNPEDKVILSRKAPYNDMASTHPTFPRNTGNGSALFYMNAAGNLQQGRLEDIFSPDSSRPPPQPLDSGTTCSASAILRPTGQQLIVTGDEDGWIKVWSEDTKDILGVECLFNCPVQAIDASRFIDGNSGSELFVLAEDGTIAAYDIKEMALSYLIPGSRHAVEMVLLSDKDLMIAYASGKTRVWYLDTLQFRRSTGIEAAEESMANRSWMPLFAQRNSESESSESSSPAKSVAHLSVPALNMPDVGYLLHNLHIWNLDRDIDDAIRSLANAADCPELSTCLQTANTVLHGDCASWLVSEKHTAWRQLLLVVLAHRYIGEPDHEVAATKVVTFYASILQDVVGSAFCSADIGTYVAYYNHPDLHVHQAARLLLDAQLGRMPDSDLLSLLDNELGHLPVNSSRSTRTSKACVKAVILMTAVALRRFSLLSPTALKDIANSVQLYLQTEEAPSLQQLAIDLAGRGFDIWQNFIDPSDMLRALFSIAVGKDEDGRHHSVIAHARAAVIQLASTSGAIFITTITMDILDAKSIAQRNSIMKLCVFVARKKPSVLLPSLPRLAEAVVKSLDPTRVNMRESIQQTATVILNELVSTYPAIDFAGKTQKLAVGTHEGAVIMYDLKTATRLYVLETHHSQVSAISFSPDGRRLVTAALDDRKLTVWKVGSSFGSIFVVGGPPRQGTGPGEPFKTYDFFVTDEDSEDQDPATGLPHIMISWPGERTACLQIGQMKLTFAT